MVVLFLLLVTLALVSLPSLGAPSLAAKSWPWMKTYDIWGPAKDAPGRTDRGSGARSTDSTSFDPDSRRPNGTTGSGGPVRSRYSYGDGSAASFYGDASDGNGLAGGGQAGGGGRRRSAKVLNFLPVPVDDECLSDDGRRTGMCMNVYECRIQGGTARGQCALGFGVCCVFVATCNEEIANNLTYFVSPSFPGIVPKDVGSCKLKIKLMNAEISQLKFDFIHFALGQPNRRTGVCEGDLFRLIGGVAPFDLCGQNSGQHLYYDLSPKSRADEQIELEMNFASRSFAQRLWEIRVSQIPFSQRSPTGCMQYFTGTEGLIQTFNFAENGRYLANHNYRACIRQEKDMCSVAYEPCDDQSFRIGLPSQLTGQGAGGGAAGGGPLGGGGVPGSTSGTGPFSDPSLADDPLAPAADIPAETAPVVDQVIEPPEASAPALEDGGAVADQEVAADEPVPAEEEPAADDPDATPADDEGSGGGGGGFFDGFFPSFFSRSIFDDDDDDVIVGGKGVKKRKGRAMSRGGGWQSPQFEGINCIDRITLPCIVEDFIGVGMGDLPTCRPVHCGNSLCPPGVSPCRVETSVTPFRLGIHFGEGTDRGSPEDNLGACIRYSQIPCAG
ncbi:AGAP008199-PA-like protein [Anopheles sinensis]|uniref:AGAP008199-PA-like protein n=1 Tax=Anopheles sinensis TaxID=74873 RepID=A0A084VFD5_ANOSI|nr:AGAP008199-PA-like protein [Anopheles sinensis]